jgi:hypothetical protein
MTNQCIGPACDEFGLFLARHRHAPIAPEVPARADRQAEAKHTQRDAGPAEEIGVAGRALGLLKKLSKRWEPQHRGDRQDHDQTHADSPAPQATTSVALRAQGGDCPVGNEQQPQSCDDPMV